jgi:alkylation response protein AidB-like acyl-CoA dehydrogenase
MDFSIPPGVLETVAKVRALLEERVLPLEPAFFQSGWRAVAPALEEARAAARAAGLFAPHLPEAWGGRGMRLAELAHVAEALGRSPLGHYALHCQAPDAGNMELLLAHGSDAQRERWLRPLARGEVRSSFAMTEPDRPGSNPTWLETRARRDGGGYVIDGRKWFASSVDGSAFTIVMAVTDPDAPPHLRASMLIVPAETPGFRLVRNIPVMGEAGEGWPSHAEVLFEGCRVPEENRLGAEGAGFALAQERLGPGRIHHCMRWIGICERAIDLLCARAVKRELAPGRPLGLKGEVQAWIAESRAETDAARLLVLRAAWRIDREGASAARDDVSAIKFFVAGVMGRVLDRAIQAHGAAGLVDEGPLAYFYRHERAARIYDGPDEVHRAALARRMLKRYGLEAREG